MSRLSRIARVPVTPPVAGGSVPVSPVYWRGNPAPAEWQQIGEYDRRPLVHQISQYVGVQRRCGIAGLAMGWAPPELLSPSGLLPWQQSKQLSSYQGTQRFGQTPSGPQPSRFDLFALRRNITQQQVAQSGPGLLKFLTATAAPQSTGIGN